MNTNESNGREIFRLQADLLKSLADPTRLMLLEELKHGEMSVGDLAERLDLRHSYASQILSVLRHTGVVIARRDGNMVYYRLASEKMITACEIVRGFIIEQLKRQQSIIEGDIEAAPAPPA
jgi:DNA-binding transcriptional ArsR family regulator